MDKILNADQMAEDLMEVLASDVGDEYHRVYVEIAGLIYAMPKGMDPPQIVMKILEKVPYEYLPIVQTLVAQAIGGTIYRNNRNRDVVMLHRLTEYLRLHPEDPTETGQTAVNPILPQLH